MNKQPNKLINKQATQTNEEENVFSSLSSLSPMTWFAQFLCMPPTWNSAIWSSLNCGAIFLLSLCNVPSIISIAKLRRREILELGKHKSTDRGEWEIQRLQLYVLLLSSESISENWPVPVLEIIISFIKTENCVCGSRVAAKPTNICQLSTILNRGSLRLQDPCCLLRKEGSKTGLY